MPTTYHPRPARCSRCGDVVLVAQRSPGTMFGARLVKTSQTQLEHADPGPNGELFDAVDDGCRRARVAP